MALKAAVARRYAEAVFDLARESNTVERWRADIQTLNDYLTNRRLLFVLSEPKVAFGTKENILRDLLNDKVQPQALGLAMVLTERDGLELMPRIAQAFEQFYNDFINLAEATVTTAVPMTDAEKVEVETALGRLTHKRIALTTVVDPAILGGVVAQVGDTLIDGSVRQRLAVLRQKILSGAETDASTT
jgi:F-type H+-transporting ATPase subunit delta